MIRFSAACTFVLFAISFVASASPWPEASLEQLALVPVQDGGRVKPLDSYARITLLKLNGKRTFTTADGKRLDTLTWLLDVLFRPELTREYEHFNVDDSDVLLAIGVTPKGKRDRYSYTELLAGRGELFKLAQQYSAMDQKKLDPFERMVMNLAVNVREYEMLSQNFDFARFRHTVPDDDAVRALFGGRNEIRLSEALAKRKTLRQLTGSGNAAASTLFNGLSRHVLSARALAFIPSSNVADKEWYTASSLFTRAMADSEGLESEIALLARLERLATAAGNAIAFREESDRLLGEAIQATEPRGEYAKIPLERRYYRLNLLFYAQWLFVVSFAMVATSWLAVKNRWLYRGALVSVGIPWLLLVISIAYRCVLRGRPPVTTLYETTLFITAVAVLLALTMELLNLQRIAVSLASVFGAFGLFLAYKYELSERQDTMPNLVAVLDTNFWLSTHVTTVTMGYAAGLLAAFLGEVYIVARLLGFRENDKSFYKSIVRMTYGTICFGLFFSIVGTVLGGIWANYSWGRFWGWDPKENGALLIVLCNIGILHARMGGYIRDLGMAMAATFNGMVVAFSWWGVNLLGVGLHSYGFTSGIWGALQKFWFFQTLMLLAGVAVYLRAVVRIRNATPAYEGRDSDINLSESIAK